MKLDNNTPFEAIALPLMGPDDKSMLTVIVKGTYAFNPGCVALAGEQAAIAFGDDFYDENDGGGIRYESDLTPFKPCTDVVLSGQAYAPGNQPAAEVDVELKVGPVQKRLKVFGRRLWNHAGIFSRRHVATPAKPFVICAIRYNEAFGGVDKTTGAYCAQNLHGKGFYAPETKPAGEPLPRVEDPGHLIRTPEDHPPPAGFGFYHRAWKPRCDYVGTYDDAWRIQRSPGKPEDFDYRFYNGAHPDLQAKGYLQGNEPVTLTNLTSEGVVEFALPGVHPLCQVQRYGNHEREPVTMHLDTVFLEPDERIFNLVWRGNAELTEFSDAGIEQVVVGCESPGENES